VPYNYALVANQIVGPPTRGEGSFGCEPALVDHVEAACLAQRESVHGDRAGPSLLWITSNGRSLYEAAFPQHHEELKRGGRHASHLSQLTALSEALARVPAGPGPGVDFCFCAQRRRVPACPAARCVSTVSFCPPAISNRRCPFTDRSSKILGAGSRRAVITSTAGRSSSPLSIHKTDGDPWEPRPNSDHLYFSVADLEPVLKRVTAAGVELDTRGERPGIATRPWGERSFYAKDPFGNPICFVEMGTEFTGH